MSRGLWQGGCRRLGMLAGLLSGLCAIAGSSQAWAVPGVVPSGSAPQTTKKAIWGTPEHQGTSMFPWYRHLGVGIFQTQAHWDEIARRGRPADPTNPEDPAYEWPAYLDRAIDDAGSYDIKVTIQLIGAPGWANGERGWQRAPNDPSDFADFATAIARRYPTVQLWMIWGEPNRRENFRPLTGARPEAKRLSRKQRRAPRAYAQLVDAAYGALKSVASENLVIGGSTYFSGGKAQIIRPYPWIRYMKLPGGGRPRMDMSMAIPTTCRRRPRSGAPAPTGGLGPRSASPTSACASAMR